MNGYPKLDKTELDIDLNFSLPKDKVNLSNILYNSFILNRVDHEYDPNAQRILENRKKLKYFFLEKKHINEFNSALSKINTYSIHGWTEKLKQKWEKDLNLLSTILPNSFERTKNISEADILLNLKNADTGCYSIKKSLEKKDIIVLEVDYQGEYRSAMSDAIKNLYGIFGAQWENGMLSETTIQILFPWYSVNSEQFIKIVHEVESFRYIQSKFKVDIGHSSVKSDCFLITPIQLMAFDKIYNLPKKLGKAVSYQWPNIPNFLMPNILNYTLDYSTADEAFIDIREFQVSKGMSQDRAQETLSSHIKNTKKILGAKHNTIVIGHSDKETVKALSGFTQYIPGPNGYFIGSKDKNSFQKIILSKGFENVEIDTHLGGYEIYFCNIKKLGVTLYRSQTNNTLYALRQNSKDILRLNISKYTLSSSGQSKIKIYFEDQTLSVNPDFLKKLPLVSKEKILLNQKPHIISETIINHKNNAIFVSETTPFYSKEIVQIIHSQARHGLIQLKTDVEKIILYPHKDVDFSWHNYQERSSDAIKLDQPKVCTPYEASRISFVLNNETKDKILYPIGFIKDGKQYKSAVPIIFEAM